MEKDPNKYNSSELIELYKESSQSFRYFLEWRFRVFQRFGILLGAVLTLAKFIYENQSLNGQILAVPALLMLLGSIVFLIMDMRNRRISKESSKVGQSIELLFTENISGIDGGFYDREINCEDTVFTYNNTLPFLYGSFVLISLAMCIFFLLKPELTM